MFLCLDTIEINAQLNVNSRYNCNASNLRRLGSDVFKFLKLVN